MKKRSELTTSDVRWAMFGNHDDSATMHHLLYNIEVKDKYIGTSVIKNAFICNKKWHVLDENEQAAPIEEIKTGSELHENIACKKCLKFYNKIFNPTPQ